jgi:hypothetical protein
MSEYVTSAHSPRQPLTSQANGFAKPVRAAAWEPQGQIDQPFSGQERVDDLYKKASGEMGANGGELEGVQEYYKSHANNKRGPVAVKGKPKMKPTTKAGAADPEWVAVEQDRNNWIHRDKLKEIETKELEAAGFRVGRASQSNSRSQSAVGRSRDRRGSETAEPNQPATERLDARRIASPIPDEDEHAEVMEEYEAWNSPSYGETAPELEASSARMNNHSVRPSTSRIPLPKTSGIPVPSALAEREAPLPRSRAGSTNYTGDAIAINGARVRSGSVGSQVLLDSPVGERQTTPPYGHRRNMSSVSDPARSPQKSPMKAKTPAKPTPTSGVRKASVPKTQPKTRQTSGTSPPKRPLTSSGSLSRPATSHRPEGEAPWLATMYKPDPRLPPDQQIIPTHAKRMRQEQWQNEGKIGSMYDKEFNVLKTDEFQDKRLSQVPIDFELVQQNETWPLTSPTKQSLEKVDSNVNKTSAEGPGTYKLTPTIPQSPCLPPPKLAPPIAPAGEPQPKVTRLPEPVTEAKEKKGLCCIVM